jgi:hypothetical protein
MSNRVLGAWMCFLLMAAPGSPQVQRGLGTTKPASDSEPYAGSYALLIGVGYKTAAWPSLPSIPGEMRALRAALEGGGFLVTTPTGEMTGQRIRQEISEFITKFGLAPRNRLLIFFAGHGHTRSFADRERGYLVPTDAPDPEKDLSAFLFSAVSMDEVQMWAKMIESRHALFVFDSCFSGSIFRTRGAPVPKYLSQQLALPVREFLTAGSANETVPAVSVFAPLFARGVKGEADSDCDGFVTATELYMWIARTISTYDVRQTPQFGKIRDPQLDQGEFLFPLRTTAASCANTALRDVQSVRGSVEEEFWAAIAGSNEAALFQRYLQGVRDGKFAGKYSGIAQGRLKELESIRSPAPASGAGDSFRSATLLRTLARLAASGALPGSGLDVRLGVVRFDGFDSPGRGTMASSPTGLRLTEGDAVAFRAWNEGTKASDVCLLFLASDGRATVIPLGDGMPGRVLQPGQSADSPRLMVTADTLGTEEVFLIAVDHADSARGPTIATIMDGDVRSTTPLQQLSKFLGESASGAAGSTRREHVVKVISWFTDVRARLH